MAVTVGNISSSSGNATTISWNHTTTAGSDKEIRVVVSVAAGESVSTVVWDAATENISGTLIRAEQNAGSVRAEIWEINDPSGGVTRQIDVNFATKARGLVGAVDFTGADVDSGVDDVGSSADAATSVSNSPTNVVADDFVVDALAMAASQGATTGANQTDIYNTGFHATIGGSAGHQDGTNGAVMSHTFSSANMAHAAARVPAVAGGAAATVSVSGPAILTLSPQGPTIQAGSRTDVSASETLTLTAPGPTVRTGASVLPQTPAVLALTPQGPTVRTGASVIPVDPAAIVLTAPGPTLESGASIFADPAGLLLSAPGPTVTIVVGGTPATVEVEGPAVLQYVVPGPTIRRGASVLSDIAQLVFRAEWPTIQAGAAVFGDVAGILINALNPTVQAGASTSVSSPASLLFAGQGATIRTGASVFSGTPSLRLSAPPPTVQAGSSVFAGPQTLVITANGPTVSIEGGRVDVDVSTPAFFTLVPGDPTVVAGAIGITKKFGVNLGISVGRESVRDPTRDVGNEGTSDWSED